MPANLPQILIGIFMAALALYGVISGLRRAARVAAADVARQHAETVARIEVERSSTATGWRAECAHLAAEVGDLRARVISIETHLRAGGRTGDR